MEERGRKPKMNGSECSDPRRIWEINQESDGKHPLEIKLIVSGSPRPAPRPPRSPLSDGPRRRSLASRAESLSDMSQIVVAKLVAAKVRRCFLLNFFVCLQLHSKTRNCRDCIAQSTGLHHRFVWNLETLF